MARMYVTYDGNYGSAADGDIIIFDTDDLTDEESDALDEDPENFFMEIANGVLTLQSVGMPVYGGR